MSYCAGRGMKDGLPTLLVAEDDENDFMLLERALRKANFETDLRRVRNGSEAMDYLAGGNGFADREAHPLPNLILLDVKMRGGSGFDVLMWLRSNEKLKNLPAVVFSNSDDPHDVQRARMLGATAYLVKPSAYDGYPKLVQALRDLWRAGTS